MNDIKFSSSFNFLILEFNKYNYTDNRGGAPTHYFAYMLEGNAKIVTEHETVLINKGDFFYVPNKCAYQSYWYGNPKIKFISLGFCCLPNFENKKYNVQVIPFSYEAEKLFLSVANADCLTAATIGEFYTLAGMLLPKMTYTFPCRSAEIIAKTEKYLYSHPHAKNPELAKHCAISEAALYAAFEKSSSETPGELRNRILLEKSKELLITTDKPIELISDTMHFSSSSYFRKKFKQHFGITPVKMRRQNGI